MAQLRYTDEGYPFYADDGESVPGDGTQLEQVLPTFDDSAFTAAAGKLYRGVRSEAREGRAPRIVDLLAGGNPEVERYQTWPEKMVRSAVTLPYDAMMGRVPDTEAVMQPNALSSFLGADPKSTWAVPAHESMIGRVQDLAGLAIGGPLTAPRGAATLRSGLERPGIGGGAVKAPTVAEATELAKTLATRAGDKWEALSSGQQATWRSKAYDHLVETRQWEAEQAARIKASQPAPVFYSAVEHAVSNARQQSATPDQWLGFLRNQPGVKAEELQWMGLEDWLRGQKGPVRKEQIDEFVKNNKVEIKEIKKGEADPKEVERALDDYAAEIQQEEGISYREARREAASRYQDDPDVITGLHDGTKYSEYQLPGGENYRELLLTLPQKQPPKISFEDWYRQTHDVPPSTQAVIRRQYEQEGQNVRNPGVYQTSHWDEPNVLAHVRVNDRMMGGKVEPFTAAEKTELDRLSRMDLEQRRAAGKQERYEDLLDREDRSVGGEGLGAEIGKRTTGGARTLFLEEVQSDWHQAGRKSGYSSGKSKAEFDRLHAELLEAQKKLAVEAERVRKEHDILSVQQALASPDRAELGVARRQAYDNDPVYQTQLAETQRLGRERNEVNPVGGIPDAPFKTTWPDLVLKRMVREAAENGYDQIAWTPGEVQAARYDLSKQIKRLHYQRLSDGGYGLWGETTAGGAHKFGDVPAKELENHVGKDIAKKILDAKDDIGVLENPDLKVGGEGMRAFYDKMLVDKANALGKKFGAKVERQPLSNPYEIYERSDSLGEPMFHPNSVISKSEQGNFVGVYDSNGAFISNIEKNAAKNRALKEFVVDTPSDPLGAALPQEAFKTRAEAETWVKDNTPSAWVMKITPKMREAAVGKGFPLFSAGLPFQFERVDHDPFSAAAAFPSPLYRTEPVDYDPFGVLPYDPNRT